MNKQISRNFLVTLQQVLRSYPLVNDTSIPWARGTIQTAQPVGNNKDIIVHNRSNIAYNIGETVIVTQDQYAIYWCAGRPDDTAYCWNESSYTADKDPCYRNTWDGSVTYSKADDESDTTTIQSNPGYVYNPLSLPGNRPTIVMPVAGFGHRDIDPEPTQAKNNLTRAMVAVGCDVREVFEINANQTPDSAFKSGMVCYVKHVRNSQRWSYNTSSSTSGCVPVVCQVSRPDGYDKTFYMPFYPLGACYGVKPSGLSSLNSSYHCGVNATNHNLDYTRFDYLIGDSGRLIYQPVYVDRFPVSQGTSTSVRIQLNPGLGGTATYVDITDSDWLNQGQHAPDIYSGDYVTCKVDASGDTPTAIPLSYPVDMATGTVLVTLGATSPGRGWVDVTSQYINSGKITVFDNGAAWNTTRVNLCDATSTAGCVTIPEVVTLSNRTVWQKQRTNSLLPNR